VLDYKQLCKTNTWSEIIKLCEEQRLDVSREVVRLIVFIRKEYGHEPLDYIRQCDWYSKYREGIEKYLLLM
jgi:hypothetical protein